MKLVYGDFWTYPADWRGVTTNGTVNAQGLNVMGSGVAKEFVDKYPLAREVVGELITKYGNVVKMIHGWNIFTFPTKNDWRGDSHIPLIRQSAQQLAWLAEFAREDTFLLVRPGIGAGRLKWDDVFPVIDPILPDNVLVITWSE
jgi:hypothetical protein